MFLLSYHFLIFLDSTVLLASLRHSINWKCLQNQTQRVVPQYDGILREVALPHLVLIHTSQFIHIELTVLAWAAYYELRVAFPSSVKSELFHAEMRTSTISIDPTRAPSSLRYFLLLFVFEFCVTI
mmetsp:Transcript_18969/g.27270  ORF Transcript_18969/g.27270 Transcript_18969/m.27270 type:complete len:126 (-) Transcript_18969:309-686(-)